MNKKGFTLLEMMVVVLMVGILASVALPQYRKAINKSKMAEAIATEKAIFDAVNMYSLTYRQCPTNLSELDAKVNATGKYWTYGLVHLPAGNTEENLRNRNCGVQVSTLEDTGFTMSAVHYMVHNPSAGVVEGLSRGDTYWTCESGNCDEFFKVIRVKKPTESATYYQ